MAEVVSLRQWKEQHPTDVIVVVQNQYTVTKILSPDYRTLYKCVVTKHPIVQKELDTILNAFKDENPSARITDVIVQDKTAEN